MHRCIRTTFALALVLWLTLWSTPVSAQPVPERAPLQLKYLGAAGWQIDVPYLAAKTGAKVIGTESTIQILRAYGIPNDPLHAVGGGEDYQFDNFSVRVVPSIHSALNEKHYFDTRRYDRDSKLVAPLRMNQFIEGGSLMFLARFDHHEVLTMGSMNFVERELEGIHPDILLAGVNGSRLGLYNQDERLLRVTGMPPIVIPTHLETIVVP